MVRDKEKSVFSVVASTTPNQSIFRLLFTPFYALFIHSKPQKFPNQFSETKKVSILSLSRYLPGIATWNHFSGMFV